MDNYYESTERVPKGASVGRYCRTMSRSRGGELMAATLIESQKLYRDSPGVLYTLKNFLKSPFEFSPVARDFYALWRERSLVGRLKDRFQTAIFEKPILAEPTDAPESVWISEGAMMPASNFLPFSENVLLVKKNGVLAIVPEDLIHLDGADVDKIFSNILVGQSAASVDRHFLSAAPETDAQPAGIFNGAPSVILSGQTKVEIVSTLEAMAAKLGSWKAPVWITNPAIFARMAALGLIDFSSGRDRLIGIDIFQSTNCSGKIVLADLAGILLADDGRTHIDTSGVSDITYVENGVKKTINLFQQGYIGYRISRYINWHVARENSVIQCDFSLPASTEDPGDDA